MAITLKKITLWRKEVDNKPGALADTRCDRRCSFIVQGAPRGSQAQSCPFPDNARRERRLPRFGLTPFWPVRLPMVVNTAHPGFWRVGSCRFGEHVFRLERLANHRTELNQRRGHLSGVYQLRPCVLKRSLHRSACRDLPEGRRALTDLNH
ncbi:MAG: hypothetical protein WCA22_13060 [Candidatus Binatus sp.]